MKNYVFISALGKEINDYLQLRKSQGFSENVNYVLQRLDQYLACAGADEKILTSDVIDGFIAQIRTKVRPNTISTYVTMCSGLGKYLNHIGIPAFVAEHFPNPKDYIPYVFSEEEIVEIFRIADNLPMERGCVAAFQIPMLLRILYGCGLRLGEALTLKLSNIDFNKGVICVLNGKGKKDRLVPMDKSLASILDQYCKSVLLVADPEQHIFPGNSAVGTHGESWARYWFIRILKEVGLYTEIDHSISGRGICLHCLRHTFAVNSYRSQYFSGIDNYRTAPIISVYLGHERLTSTEQYLHFCEENYQDILSITEQYAGVFPEVPDEE